MNKSYSTILGLVLATLTAAPSLTFGQANTYPWPSSGNVGIGTTSPGAKVVIKGGNTNDLVVDNDGSQYTEIDLANNGTIKTGWYWDNTNSRVVFSQGPYVFPSGNVGIGTTNPIDKLTVQKEGSPSIGIFNSSWGIGDEAILRFRHGDGIGDGSGNGAQSEIRSFLPGGGNSDLRFYTTNYLSLNATPALTLTGQNNVGIGTTSPSTAKLVVASPQMVATNTVIGEFTKDGSTNDYGSALLRISRILGGNSTDLELNSGGAGPFRYGTYLDTLLVSNQNATNGPYGSIQFVTNNAVRVTIGGGTLAGNIGIGTTSPAEKLAVNGKIRAKEVIVETNWSDYVFDPAYRLAPLSEVEEQIKAEKHLSGIPSAQQIAENGVSLGDMQARLLQKVEELTLHAIEQEKEIQALKSQLQELQRH
jgi:hypothetical protein